MRLEVSLKIYQQIWDQNLCSGCFHYHKLLPVRSPVILLCLAESRKSWTSGSLLESSLIFLYLLVGELLSLSGLGLEINHSKFSLFSNLGSGLQFCQQVSFLPAWSVCSSEAVCVLRERVFENSKILLMYNLKGLWRET
jgi:hypothetical protein